MQIVSTETICKKCYILFSKKNIISLLSAESVHSMVSVNDMSTLIGHLCNLPEKGEDKLEDEWKGWG